MTIHDFSLAILHCETSGQIVDRRAALPDHPRAPSTAPVPAAVAVSAAPNRRRLKGRDVLGMLGDAWNKADITDVLFPSIS